MNPDWELRTLSSENLARYTDVAIALGDNRESATPQAISDVVRMNLLAEYGGVWADATVLCCKPLDAWLWSTITGGFFVFTNPGPDRLISSWFMASSPGNPLTLQIRDAVHRYWSERVFSNLVRPRLKRRLEKLLSRRAPTTRFWFSGLVRDGLRLYPYFWLHYLFADTVRRNPTAACEWSLAGKLPAEGPIRLQAFGMAKPPDAEMMAEIDHAAQPMYKLDGRKADSAIGTGGALDYLLNRWELR